MIRNRKGSAAGPNAPAPAPVPGGLAPAQVVALGGCSQFALALVFVSAIASVVVALLVYAQVRELRGELENPEMMLAVFRKKQA